MYVMSLCVISYMKSLHKQSLDEIGIDNSIDNSIQTVKAMLDRKILPNRKTMQALEQLWNLEKLRRKEHNEKLLKGNTNQLGEIGVDNIASFLLYVENKGFICLVNARKVFRKPTQS